MKKQLFVLILVVSLSFALVQSGDAGKQFAADKTAELCNQTNLSAVFICNGNVVRGVYSAQGAGSIFYKPDGKIVSCPDVPPPQMGAECLQMMTPNYCPQKEQCGESNTTSYFPPNNLNQTVVPPAENQTPANNTAPSPPPAQNITSPGNSGNVTNVVAGNNQTGQVPELPVDNTIKTGAENPLGYLLPVVVMLGIAAIVVLFLLFRNSMKHE